MADRCGACGTWLVPGEERCSHCHAPTVGTPQGDPFDDPLMPSPESEAELEVAPVARAATRRSSAPPSPRAKPPQIHSDEILTTADYGPTPDGLFAAVPYAINVWLRRQALSAASAEAARKLGAAERASRGASSEVGRQLLDRAHTLDLHLVADALAAAQRAQGEAEQHGEKNARVHADVNQRKQELAAELEQATREANPWRDRETKLRTQLELKQHDVKRAEAKLGRTEIELRNVRATGSDPDRVALLEADHTAREAELGLLKDKVQELTTELGQVRRELASRLGRVAAVSEEKKRSEASLSLASKVHGATVSRVESNLEAKLADLGELAMERDVASEVPPDVLRRAERAAAERFERLRERELYRLAMDAWDRPAVKRGASVIAGATVLLLAALIAAVVR